MTIMSICKSNINDSKTTETEKIDVKDAQQYTKHA